MSSAYGLLPSSNNEWQKTTKRRAFHIPWNSRTKFYSLAVFTGIFFQLLFLAYPRVLIRKTESAHCSETQVATGEKWSLEKARKMVSNTKGYYARDYSLNLGWNNVRYIIEASVYQAKLLNRTLILPSFVYARSCNYDLAACASFLPKVHWTEAVHSIEWSDHPFEQEYLFRVPLEIVMDLDRLRAGPTKDHWNFERDSEIIWPVITAAEYLQLHGLAPKIEQHNGYWGRLDYQLPPGTNVTAYHETLEAEIKAKEDEDKRLADEAVNQEGHAVGETGNAISRSSLSTSGLRRAIQAVNTHKKRSGTGEGSRTIYEMFNEEWDTAPLVRVDDLQALKKYSEQKWEWSNRSLALSGTGALDNEMSQRLFAILNETLVENNQVVLGIEQTKRLAREMGYQNLESNGDLENVLNDAGWDFVHTFEGRLNEEFIKTIIWPMTQVAPRAHMRGFVNDLDSRTEDVVLVSGEIHLERKAGLMRFTSSTARDAYTHIGLYAMRAPEQYWRIAARVEAHMRARCGGRMFMAAHIRRGDFIRFGWAPNENLETHVKLVQEKLVKGGKLLAAIKKEYAEKTETGNIDNEILRYEPPQDGDPFYVATDENSQYGIELIHRLGGVLINDLLTPEDRTACGWEMLYSDLVALVEQIVMSRASYWNAHAMSSLAGGVVNLRAARGADPRTALLD